jgi:hypothetical protein
LLIELGFFEAKLKRPWDSTEGALVHATADAREPQPRGTAARAGIIVRRSLPITTPGEAARRSGVFWTILIIESYIYVIYVM